MIHAVEVYKTPDASLIGQGLAGTIDLQTTRPLEYGKRTLVLDVRGIKNGNGDLGAGSTDQQYRASFSYVDQYFDNTLGFTFGFARLDTPTDTKEVGLYDAWHTNGTEHAGVPAGAWVTDGIKSLASTGLDKTSYNDVLPSANLVFGLPSNQKLRVGLARELVRARMDQMDVSYDYGYSTSSPFIPSATGGNAKLAP